MNKKFFSSSFLIIASVFFFQSFSVFAAASSVPSSPSAVSASAPLQSIGNTVPVTVTWTDNSDNESGFSITPFYQGGLTPVTNSGLSIIAGASANATSYTFATSSSLNLIPATTTPIFFVVRAINSFGASVGSTSTAVVFLTLPPNPPTNINAVLNRVAGTRAIVYSIKITWTDSLNDLGYLLKKFTITDGVSSLPTVIALAQDTVSYIDTSVVKGNSYYYQLQAVTGTLSSTVISSGIIIVPTGTSSSSVSAL